MDTMNCTDARQLEDHLAEEAHDFDFAQDAAGRPWILYPTQDSLVAVSHPLEGEELSEALRSLDELEYPVRVLAGA